MTKFIYFIAILFLVGCDNIAENVKESENVTYSNQTIKYAIPRRSDVRDWYVARCSIEQIDKCKFVVCQIPESISIYPYGNCNPLKMDHE